MRSAVFVINLEKNPERMRLMQEQLDSLGVPFERLDAVYGKDLTEEQVLKKYCPTLNKSQYFRPLTRGEIGVYFSNILVWQKIIAEDLDFAISLEDDISLSEDFPEALKAIENISRDWDCIKLGNPGKKKRTLFSEKIGYKNFSLLRTSKPPTFCVGQAISRAGAKKLLETRKKFGRPVDVDLQWFWENDLKIFSLSPECVSLSEMSEDSTKNPPKDPPAHRFAAKLRMKLRYAALLTKTNLTYKI